MRAATTMGLSRAFNKARDVLDGYRDLMDTGDVARLLDGLEKEAVEVLYDENERGGKAREAVSNVARVLGVDIDSGPGHRWDPEHMARVIAGAERIRDDRDHWRQEAENQGKEAELWKSLAQRQDNTAPLRRELRIVEREHDELKRRVEYLGHQVEGLTSADDVDELRATVVRQANEITRLTGESA